MEEQRKLVIMGNNKQKYDFVKKILIYTGLFLIFIGYIIYIFIKYDKSFICQVDGLKQYIVILKYFRDLIIQLIRTGQLSTFTWSLGFGFNMFGNLAYYIFGDFFSYFSILVPTSQIENLYSVLIFVRLYFVGIAFLYFCKHRNMNTTSSIVGALMYTFSTFALYVAVRHPYFINAMIIFPLVMVGIERLILENKKIFYIVTIALLFIINFYFAYMIAIIVAIYGITLTIYTYKKDGAKKVIAKLAQILVYSLIGIMISAIILLPTIVEFLNSERSGTDEIYPYKISYYRDFLSSLVDLGSGGYWKYWGVQSIILITLPIFVRKRKQDYPIFILTIILLVALLIAPIGSILCGFSYPNNRWTFIMAFIFSFITTMFINDGSKLEKRDLIAVVLFAIFYLLVNWIFDVSINAQVSAQLVIAIIILLFIMSKEKLNSFFKRINLYDIGLVCIICIGILSSIYYRYEIDDDTLEYVSDFIDSESLNDLINTSNDKIEDFDEAIEYIQGIDSGFYCISKYPYSYENVSLVKEYRSIGIYYSIIPDYYSKLSLDLQNIQYEVNFGLKEFNYRTKITTLLGEKYYITNDEGILPYGYKKLEDYEGTSSVYVNQYSLSFATLYTDYITEEEYEEMTPLEKESSLLKAAVLENEKIEETTLEYNDETQQEIENIISEVDYTITDEYEILNDDNTATITDTSENTIEIEIDTIENSELYLYIDNIEFMPYTKDEIVSLKLGQNYTEEKEKEVEDKYKYYRMNYNYSIIATFNDITYKKEVEDYTCSPYYFENNEMLVNLGYYDEISGTVILSFSELGTYDLSSIQILAVSMEGYEEDIENLNESNFEVIDYGNGYINGTANPATDGVLQFSTIYNKGWTIYVDGEKVETMSVNEYFLGINITSGEHTIYMEYSTPYLKIGAVISLIGIILFIGIIIHTKRKQKGYIK